MRGPPVRSQNQGVTEIGVVFRPQSPPERLGEVVRAAQDADVAQLWVWEDCFAEGGLSAAAAALAWSSSLQVGIGLLPVPLRNPALTAMEIATLARMFPGRLLPGLGHGVLDWMGQVGARVASPMALLREHVTAVRALLKGETVTMAGRYVHLDGVVLDWPPAVVPPLYVGARGPLTVALAAELTDGVLLDSGASVDAVRAARATVPSPGSVVVNVGISDLGALDDLVAEFAAAGADTVVFEAPAADPDPLPLIAAIARRRTR